MAVNVADRSATRERVKISGINLTASLILPLWLKSKEAGCQTTQSHHHAVSIVVIVMCLMLKCMQTSKGPNPDQYSDLVILFLEICDSGHAHSCWAFRHPF